MMNKCCNDKKVIGYGGSGYKTYLVLKGEVDAYLHITKIKVWDLCAGHALLKTMGGDIKDKNGKPLIYDTTQTTFQNGLIAAINTQKINEYSQKINA